MKRSGIVVLSAFLAAKKCSLLIEVNTKNTWGYVVDLS